MPTDPNAPADPRMMTIVHQAMRRDLERARIALTADPPPDAKQRQAIARHLTWMTEFIRDHHTAEDSGLYPLVRERRPDVAQLLDAMHADHEAVSVAMRDLDTAAAAYGQGDDHGERVDLLVAVEHLQTTLLPHLDREEREVMPVVSAAITNREWDELEQEHNLDPKSFSELGRIGHWLIDEAGPDDRATVLGVVPPVPRFILLHGFARSYRRQKAACWHPETTGRGVQMHGQTRVTVPASIDDVWDVAGDPSRVGEWSHECLEVSWLGDATSPVPGARFRGRNRQGLMRWGRVCEIIASDPYELAYRTVPTALFPDSTVWRLRLREVDGGTEIEQRFEVVRGPKVLSMLYAVVVPAHRDRTDALEEDLRRLGALAVQARPVRETLAVG